MNEELAKKRFMILTAVRFSALFFIFAGAANVAGKFLPDLGTTPGYIMLLIGVVDFFVAPVILKSKWRTPDQ
jgi:hypothetical protein